MTIQSDLPFEFCEKCVKQCLDINKQVLYSYDQIVAEDVLIICQHAEICKYIVRKTQEGMIK